MNMDFLGTERNKSYIITLMKYWRPVSGIVKDIFVCSVVKTKIKNYKNKCLNTKKLIKPFLKLWILMNKKNKGYKNI